MHRVFWHVPFVDFEIYSYGFMIMVGFLLAIWVAMRRARVVGIDPLIVIDLTVWLLIAGIGGARVMFVLHFWEKVWDDGAGLGTNLVALVNIRDGGLEFYGGLLAAVPVGTWYLRRRRVPLAVFFDLALPTVAIGLAFGRMGCFLNGCCYGKICDGSLGFLESWGVSYPQFLENGEESIPFHAHASQGLIPLATEAAPPPGVPTWEVTREALEHDWVSPKHYTVGQQLWGATAPLIPSQLVSSIVNTLVFVFLSWVWARAYVDKPERAARRRRPRYGEVAALFGICYAVVRFSLELLRQDTKAVWLESWHILGKDGLTISQVISLGIFAVSATVYGLLLSGRIGKPIALAQPEDSTATPAPPARE